MGRGRAPDANVKDNNVNRGEDALKSAMRAWKVEATLSPRFAENVWRDIAREPAQPTVAAAIREWFALVFTRPALAIGYMTLLVGLGTAIGYWQGQQTTAKTNLQLSSRYLQSVDPYHRGL